MTNNRNKYYANSYAYECLRCVIGYYLLYISKITFNELEISLKLNVSIFPPPSLPLLDTPSLEAGSQFLALTNMEVTK